MEITYIGHSCFVIKGKEATLVVDPYDPEMVGYKLPKLKAEIVLVTHDHEGHNNVSGISEHELLVEGPGEYETHDIFIQGIDTFHDGQKGAKNGRNTIYLIDIDNFNILHLGDLGHELSKENMAKIPDVNVLLIPVGGKSTIDAEAASKVISSLEPNYVVPMHYATDDLKFKKDLDGVEKFLDEMGADGNVQRVDTLKLSSKTDIAEKMEVVVLNPQH